MFEETLEEMSIATSAAFLGEPAVKALGVRGVRGKRKGMKGGPVCRCDAQRRSKDMRKETNLVGEEESVNTV